MWLIMTNHVAILQRIFHRQCRSFGQYLAECWPWTHRVDREAQDLVRSIITDERRWAERLAELITERGGVPQPGNYPTEFTDSHFLALDFMLRRLVEEIGRDIAILQSDHAVVQEDATLRSFLEQMVERKKGQVEALRKLVASLAETQIRSY